MHKHVWLCAFVSVCSVVHMYMNDECVRLHSCVHKCLHLPMSTQMCIHVYKCMHTTRLTLTPALTLSPGPGGLGVAGILSGLLGFLLGSVDLASGRSDGLVTSRAGCWGSGSVPWGCAAGWGCSLSESLEVIKPCVGSAVSKRDRREQSLRFSWEREWPGRWQSPREGRSCGRGAEDAPVVSPAQLES